jgi:phosphatidate cytidylyltransferase
MSEIWKRAIFGSLYVIVLLACTYLSPYSLIGLFLLLTILGTKELIQIIQKSEIEIQTINAYLLSILTFSVFVLSNHYFNYTKLPYLVVIYALIISVVEIHRNKPKGIIVMASTLFPSFFIGFAFACLVNIALYEPLFTNEVSNLETTELTILNLVRAFQDKPFNPFNLIMVYALVWVNDTFAYLTGRVFGKHKLMESISPKKTWEGFIGGMVFTSITAFVLIYLNTHSIRKASIGSILGIIISIGATYGDLVESMAKRSVGIKDSGNVIPGHGGILDRLDSLLFIGPLVYAVLEVINHHLI